MKKIFPLLFLIFAFNLSAQDEIISQEYYEGVLNNNIEISLYLKVYEDGCPRTYVDAIYKYKSNKENNWILLSSVFSLEKKQYTFVEYGNTGILLLKKGENKLTGMWISPDGKKQFQVELKKVKIDSKKIDTLEDQLEKEFYYANDC